MTSGIDRLLANAPQSDAVERGAADDEFATSTTIATESTGATTDR